jgi:serine/threonine protein kinase
MALLEANALVANRFRLEREIGRGGMGSVWLAQHTELDVPCAVKFMEAVSSEQTRERFRREAKAAAKLRGSHVVQVFDHGVWQGIPYIVMELLEGEDLRQRLTRQGRLEPKECYAIVLQVARALAKAHGMGIIHRDLKPDNIFLCKDGDHEVVKVLDFGIAKILGDQAVIGGVETKTGTLLGTPYYMSPEQLQGTKSIDHRSDLWSLAVVIYECLVGERPFSSEGMGDLVMQIMGFPLPVPSERGRDLPPAFDDWWSKAASRDPGERYADIHELVLGLATALGEEAPNSDALARSSGSGSRRTSAWNADALGETAEAPTPDPGRPPSLSGGNLSQSLVVEPPAARKRPWPLLAAGGAAAALLAALLLRGNTAPAASQNAPSTVAAPSPGTVGNDRKKDTAPDVQPAEPPAAAPLTSASTAPPQPATSAAPAGSAASRTAEPPAKRPLPAGRKETPAPTPASTKPDMGF